MSRYHLLSTIFAHIIYTVEAEGEGCPDLSFYTHHDREAFDTFMNSQVQQYNNEPVYFKIPSGPAPYKYCLRDVRIPDAIGGTSCRPKEGEGGEPNNRCMLLIGMHALDGESSDTLSPVFDRDGYSCLCQGYSFYEDAANTTFGSGTCGITNFNEWAVTCPQVGMRDEQNISVVISACPENRPDLNGCNVCGGETSLGPITVRPLKVAAKTIEKCASHAWHINPL